MLTLICFPSQTETSLTIHHRCIISFLILPVEIVWSVPCNDSHWDVEDVIVGELEGKSK